MVLHVNKNNTVEYNYLPTFSVSIIYVQECVRIALQHKTQTWVSRTVAACDHFSRLASAV